MAPDRDSERGRPPAGNHPQAGSEAERREDADTEKLIERAQGGEDRAFGEVYTRYFGRVLSYLRLLLESPEDAEDAAQDVFVNALAALDRYERRPDQPFRAWLFTIARNHGTNLLRVAGRTEPVDPAELNERIDASGAAAPEEPFAGLSPLNWITDTDLSILMERLPLPQRQVLLLRYVHDLEHAEVARILGRTPADVRKLQQRAQDFLHERLIAIGRRGEQTDRPQAALARRPHAYVLRARRFSLDR